MAGFHFFGWVIMIFTISISKKYALRIIVLLYAQKGLIKKTMAVFNVKPDLTQIIKEWNLVFLVLQVLTIQKKTPHLIDNAIHTLQGLLITIQAQEYATIVLLIFNVLWEAKNLLNNK